MRFFSAALAMFAAASMTGPGEAFAGGAQVNPGAGPVERLVRDVAAVMERLKAPLGLNDAELAELVAPAQVELDPVTGRPYRTRGGNPLPYYVFEPEHDCSQEPPRTVLFIGGIHGDEVAPMYSSFRALNELIQNPRRRPANTRVIYVPIANPDGFLVAAKPGKRPTRHNLRGVDLNRNFASSKPEVETRFLKQLIVIYRPTHVVSLHGPFGWLDYDGPAQASGASSELRAHADEWLSRSSRAGRRALPANNGFGTYVGSMGNYGGTLLERHVMTIEYPHEDSRFAEDDWHDYGDTVLEALNPGSSPVDAVTVPGAAR